MESLVKVLLGELELSPNSPRSSVLIQELTTAGHYPVTPFMRRYHYTAEQMVRSYGVQWDEYPGPHRCPGCGRDLRDHNLGPPFKREVGIYYDDRDYTLRCPDCNLEFERGTLDVTHR